MNAKRIYICAAIFIFLSSVKYFLPEYSVFLREEISELIEGDEDYGGKVTAIGRKLYTGELKDELVQAFKVHDDELLPENVLPDRKELPFECCRPVSGDNSSGFGYRAHPIEGDMKFHYGVDLAAESGAEVFVFADGIVSAAGTNDSFGNYLLIQHMDGYCSLYAHLHDFAVSEGYKVSKGELVAYVGQSGKTTGPHLHFELTCDGLYMNPEHYL